VGASGSGVDCSLRGSVNTPENSPEQSGKQQAIIALRRDFIAEALRVVAVKATHAADNVELGDDIGAEREISIVINHVKAAAATFREMQNAGGSQ